jgi:hypothetical protein
MIPIVATLLAIAVLSWRSRDRPIDPHDSVAERMRFERALSQPPAQGRGGSRSGARPPGASGSDAAPASADDDVAGEDTGRSGPRA